MPEEHSGTPEPDRGAAPWASDLEQRFDDPAQREAVDQYLRERWQPRMTQLEQQAAVSRDAEQLWNAFQEDPNETFLQVSQQLYGDESRDVLIAALSGEHGAQAQQEATQAVEAAQEAQQGALSDEDRSLLNEVRSERNAQEYRQAIDSLIDQSQFTQGQAIHAKEHVHAFVAAADGDLEEGLRRYQAAFNGANFEAPAPEVQETGVTPAPTVMDGQGGTAAAPPHQRQLSWDDAFSEFGDEIKASNRPSAPPVGPA